MSLQVTPRMIGESKGSLGVECKLDSRLLARHELLLLLSNTQHASHVPVQVCRTDLIRVIWEHLSLAYGRRYFHHSPC